ncbi:MAG TPA: aminotransferase class V-fold PLP-dependent enzyme [Candidatus Saccharimonadales bacterium]|nr:aminotransferase class V-fold PLP-dependent enzyme [Candidatus Saccharimonadales bacterium]
MFRKKTEDYKVVTERLPEFGYLKDGEIYMDSSCQSLRPEPVIDSLSEYYKSYGACGGRVKYKWGQTVDSIVQDTRELVIDYLGLSQKDYVCSFTLNTTYGLNLVLGQLPSGNYRQVATSEIEHNSVFLPTINLAKRLGLDRKILKRDDDGSLNYQTSDLIKAIVVVNSTSNIDGRLLLNIKQLIKDTHEASGIVIIDAAQTVAHYHELLVGCGADLICFSGHKMYAASLGVIVIKKELLKSLNIGIVGGGMVTAVSEQGYTLHPDDLASWLEPGLQAYGEIISLNHAIKWLKTVKPGGLQPSEYIAKLSEKLYSGLSEITGLTMFNHGPSSVISVCSQKVDAHRLATFLSASGVMVRSGYFCCHYYLLEKLKTPPLLRFSIGLHTTEDDIDKTIEIMKKITKG